MQIKKILTKEEIKDIEEIIEKNYGCKIKIDGMFLTKDDKLWIASPPALKIAESLKRCYRIGIYFGRLKRNNKIKLNIEGAIIIGRKARKNVAYVDDNNAIKFAQGYDIQNFECNECEINNFIIVKRGEDAIGVGILREGYIENLISKARRLNL